MAYEIEFLPVGEGTKAGDAIVVAYGSPPNHYEVMVIDGGTEESGEAVVKFIRERYGHDRVVSHVVSTHPDADHISGLRTVLREMTVSNLWVHGLWTHAPEILAFFQDKRWTAAGLGEYIKRQYPLVSELVSLAEAQGTRINEPFQGAQVGPFIVLSPKRANYQRLVPQFRKTPEPDEEALRRERVWIGKQTVWQPLDAFLQGLKDRIADIADSWNVEVLREGGVTAAENETSTVLYGHLDGHPVLLTADAGENALFWTHNYAQSIGIDLKRCSMIQVPHHGSRRNVSPSTLDMLIGERLPAGSTTRRMTAIVSAPRDDEAHPRRIVMNAFLKRGAPVFATQGRPLRFARGLPQREGYQTAEALPFFAQVEEYD